MSVFEKNKQRIADGNDLTWKDLVCVPTGDGYKVFAEEFPIEHEYDVDEEGEIIFRIDDFLGAVAEKHGCDADDVLTWTMDGEFFDEEADMPEDYIHDSGFPFGCESCGAWVNGEQAEDVLAREDDDISL